MKKLFALILALIMVLSLAMPAFAETEACDCPNTPVIYVYGRHTIYFKNENDSFKLDENGNFIDVLDRPVDIEAMASDLLPKFVKAYVTRSYDEWAESFLGYILPLYDEIGVYPNGEIIDKDLKKYSRANITSFCSYGGQTHGDDYRYINRFSYDYRKSPLEVADELNEYIQKVKERTGHSKVSFIARCQGANMLLTYLNRYEEKAEDGFEDIESITLLNGTQDGIDFTEALFSGNVSPDADAVYRLATTYDLQELVGDTAGKLLTFMLDSLKETYGLELTVKMVKTVFDNVKSSVLPEWLRAFYAVCGCNLSCVKDEFDEAIDFIFPTDEIKQEYAPIIEKATYVNKNVTVRTAEILKAAEAKGVRIGVVAEYGQQPPPLNKQASYVGDTLLALEDQTLGATCAKIDGTLSDKYIRQQVEKRLGQYISPDLQVDTSTAAFPDTTWVVKNVAHTFPKCIHDIIFKFIREGIDVTDKEFPGFLNFVPFDYEDPHNFDSNTFSEPNGTLLPLQKHNPNDIQWKDGFHPIVTEDEPEGFFEKLVFNLKIFFETLKNYFTRLFDLFK